MPNPIIPVPKFPNVPKLPGVPQLIRANQAIGTVQLAVGAIQKFLGNSSAKRIWGITDQNGNLIIKPSSYLGFDNQQTWKISDFPLQDGDFSTYNKVVIPPTIVLKIAQGGSFSDRANLLAKLSSIGGDFNLYNILVPEGTYINYNCEGFTIRRMGSSGAYYFADLDVHFRKIKQTTSQYSSTTANTSNAKNPPALPAQNQGTQSPQTAVPPAVQAAVQKLITTLPF